MLRIALFGALVLHWVVSSQGVIFADERDDFFETRIRPVLIESCFRCHGDAKISGELRVDSRDALLQGGESGPAIELSNPEESLLIQAIRRQPDVAPMPPDNGKALRRDQVADFVTWIKNGAVWPAASTKFLAANHWAFEPVRDHAPLEVNDKAWSKTSVDSFIRAKQEAAGLNPAQPADKLALIRRATFDLTGLPPTPQEIEAFLGDSSPQAFESVVDRLLASRAYGERWGRHWLDIVRYADTAGETADYPVPLAWRYRNYVIDAFNSDKPYNEFLREQIAGDIFADPTSREDYAERVIATGYLAISRRFGFDSENYQHLTIQDSIDTLGQTVMGLSLGCARCHDHKFDPISMHDYYALYGIFESSRYPFPGSEQKQQVRSLAPLLPPDQSQLLWREFNTRLAQKSVQLARQNQPLSGAVLRSLHDVDGDFELQAPAAGGSNGVLVPPWLSEGKIAVTNDAQSPFKNLNASGRNGISVPTDAGPYRIRQAIYPRRAPDNCRIVYVNLDFRITDSDPSSRGSHRFSIGSLQTENPFEILFSANAVALQSAAGTENICAIMPGQWYNLQLAVDLAGQTVSGTVGMPGAVIEFSDKPFVSHANLVLEQVVFDFVPQSEARTLAVQFDNLGIQTEPIPPVSTEPPAAEAIASATDQSTITDQLRVLSGMDGDFELQTQDAPPAAPWNPGPNSVVKISSDAQSPFRNVFPRGELGVRLPDRGEYDGFGWTVSNVQPDDAGRLFVSLDFCCARTNQSGNGSWRYYLGQGAGSSAAIELFWNGTEFFKRSGNAIEAVGPIEPGHWYQLQLTLNLQAKTFTGLLASTSVRTEFSGLLAADWNGQIDYAFIDSFGHIGGVRPSLDADNFYLGVGPLPSLDGPPVADAAESHASRRARIKELRSQLASIQELVQQERQALNEVLAKGPCEMAYGMAEGTPHDVAIQKRGEPDQRGAEVPRGFIKILGGEALPANTRGSGRLELANWLTRPLNPLTARVMVNRIWQFHFGRGLVKTPNDFGARGLTPTHPELLDHLAAKFVQCGWSIKAMHRVIMLSATYQQSSISDSALVDSATRNEVMDLYVGSLRRRLSAEEIRDSILSISGELDPTPAREHPFPSPTSWGFTQHAPFSAVYDHNQRSVYLMVQRLKRHPFLALFDGADPNATTADRLNTTVPTQALYFLNDPFVHAKAQNWAHRLLDACPNEAERIRRAWQHALGRLPTEVEQNEATNFLTVYRGELVAIGQDDVDARALAAYLRTLFGSNEFLFLD